MKWVPVERHDGSRGWVDNRTGEVVGSISEALGFFALDAELLGLLAEEDLRRDD